MAFLGEKTKKAASLSETSLQCKRAFGEELKLTAAWEKLGRENSCFSDESYRR